MRLAAGPAAARRRAAQNHHCAPCSAAPTAASACAPEPGDAEVLRQLELLSQSAATVLLTGESGTGKGLVAKALHLRSAARRAAVRGPELRRDARHAGRERTVRPRAGRLHRARAPRRAGLLLRANRGTLFLDEIADMSLGAGEDRALPADREFLPLGGQAPVAVDVRVMAATNRDLPALVQSGAFRPELLWRLDVVALRCRRCANGARTCRC
jgi:two-component system nitrogen regulation response regulator GlnG